MRIDKVLYVLWQSNGFRAGDRGEFSVPWATYCYGAFLRTGRYPWNASER